MRKKISLQDPDQVLALIREQEASVMQPDC